jgi:uncharacterized membrane protein YoaK (UPF0700 family)
VLLLLLTSTAGYVDAVSYLGLERVFTANMTGNTVLLGLALVQEDSQAAIRSGLALVGFVGGCVLGAWIVERGQSRSLWPTATTVALALEWCLLLAFAAAWYATTSVLSLAAATPALIGLSALAMGVQSAAVRRLDVSGIATTYITGTLTNLVARCLRWGRDAQESVGPGRLPPRSTPTVGLLAAVWGVYLGGAVGAAAALMWDQLLATVLPTAVLLVVIGAAAICFRRTTRC